MDFMDKLYLLFVHNTNYATYVSPFTTGLDPFIDRAFEVKGECFTLLSPSFETRQFFPKESSYSFSNSLDGFLKTLDGFKNS